MDDFDFEHATQMTDAEFTFRANPSWTVQVAAAGQCCVYHWDDKEEAMYHHGCFSGLAAAADYVRSHASTPRTA